MRQSSGHVPCPELVAISVEVNDNDDDDDLWALGECDCLVSAHHFGVLRAKINNNVDELAVQNWHNERTQQAQNAKAALRLVFGLLRLALPLPLPPLLLLLHQRQPAARHTDRRTDSQAAAEPQPAAVLYSSVGLRLWSKANTNVYSIFTTTTNSNSNTTKPLQSHPTPRPLSSTTLLTSTKRCRR